LAAHPDALEHLHGAARPGVARDPQEVSGLHDA
jgi:hypothetical protein